MENRKIIQAFALVTQLGLSMLVPIVMCVWLGQFLNNRFSIDITVLLLILGILAGCRSCWKLLMGAAKNQNPKSGNSASRTSRRKQEEHTAQDNQDSQKE